MNPEFSLWALQAPTIEGFRGTHDCGERKQDSCETPGAVRDSCHPPVKANVAGCRVQPQGLTLRH